MFLRFGNTIPENFLITIILCYSFSFILYTFYVLSFYALKYYKSDYQNQYVWTRLFSINQHFKNYALNFLLNIDIPVTFLAQLDKHIGSGPFIWSHVQNTPLMFPATYQESNGSPHRAKCPAHGAKVCSGVFMDLLILLYEREDINQLLMKDQISKDYKRLRKI